MLCHDQILYVGDSRRCWNYAGCLLGGRCPIKVTILGSATDLETNWGIYPDTGHLAILRQSPTVSREDDIHAHAVPNTPASQVHFATSFPQPGKYQLWGQFNRNGEIITADYWVEVQ